jgi:hypothetical protein
MYQEHPLNSIRTLPEGTQTVTLPEYPYLQLPYAMARKCGLISYSKVWFISKEFHHVNNFALRHFLMDPTVEEHPVTSPDTQPLINALEDIASMLAEDMRSWRTPPVTDNFTQLWLQYFRSQRANRPTLKR